jgi:hypothetical protein
VFKGAYVFEQQGDGVCSSLKSPLSETSCLCNKELMRLGGWLVLGWLGSLEHHLQGQLFLWT